MIIAIIKAIKKAGVMEIIAIMKAIIQQAKWIL